MKIQYTGHKERMTILLPIGTRMPSKAKKKINLKSGQEFELEDSEAEKLMGLDPNYVKVDKKVVTEVKEETKIKKK